MHVKKDDKMIYFMEANVGNRHKGEEGKGKFCLLEAPKKFKTLFHRYHLKGKSKWGRNKVIITEFSTPNQTFFKIAEIAVIQDFLQHELEFLWEKKVFKLQMVDSQGELIVENLCHEP